MISFFTDTLPLTPEIQALPNMQGSGAVRDLSEAASQSALLQSLLTQYTNASTRAEQLSLIDQLLDAWADTSGMAETLDERDPGSFVIRHAATLGEWREAA